MTGYFYFTKQQKKNTWRKKKLLYIVWMKFESNKKNVRGFLGDKKKRISQQSLLLNNNRLKINLFLFKYNTINFKIKFDIARGLSTN